MEGVRWAGIADAGEAVGKGWLNWMAWEPEGWCPMLPLALLGGLPWAVPFGAKDWMVVRVVVRERTEGAGEEKVLSPPRRDSRPPWAVRLVPARDEAPCDRAVIDREPSWSVDLVPPVGGARPSSEERVELSASCDIALDLLVLRAVDNE